MWVLLVCLMVLHTAPCKAAPVSCTDDTGTVITLEAPARRIIALYGAFNEILVEMGQSGRIVARTDADEAIPALAGLPAIGTHMRPNPELVAGLAPDLILQMEGRREAATSVDALRALGIPVAVFRVASFGDLFSVLHRMGTLTGAEQDAAALEARWTARLDTVAGAIARQPHDTGTADGKDHTQPPPRVVFEVRYPNLLAAGADSIVNDIITRAGGVNAVQQPGRVVRLNEEELLRMAPDAYVYQYGPMNPTPVTPDQRPHFTALDAIRDGRVLKVDEHAFSRPGPRSVEAVEQLARFLHPAAFDTNTTTARN